MKTDLKYFNYVMYPIVAVGMAYGMFSAVNKNTTSDSEQDIQYNAKKLDAFLKADSLAKQAYFEGIQKVRDSLKKENE